MKRESVQKKGYFDDCKPGLSHRSKVGSSLLENPLSGDAHVRPYRRELVVHVEDNCLEPSHKYRVDAARRESHEWYFLDVVQRLACVRQHGEHKATEEGERCTYPNDPLSNFIISHLLGNLWLFV